MAMLMAKVKLSHYRPG